MEQDWEESVGDFFFFSPTDFLPCLPPITKGGERGARKLNERKIYKKLELTQGEICVSYFPIFVQHLTPEDKLRNRTE